MQIIRHLLQCSGKQCELLPDDLENGENLIKALIIPVLQFLPWCARIEKVKLNFSRFQNMYTVEIIICCFENFILSPDDVDRMEVKIESLIGPVLLQLLGEISPLENAA